MVRRGPGRPKRDVRTPDHAELMRNGLRAFAELGYEAVSVRELNERLGMGHTFVHDRYGSKEAFWQAVVAHEFRTLAAELAPALTSEPDDDLDWLVRAVRVFHRVSAHHPALNRVIDYEAARESGRLDYLFTLTEPLNQAIRPVFERLVAAGRVRDIPWHAFHFAVVKPALLYGQEPWARRFGRPDDADDSGTIAEIILHGLLT
ncbi:TetR/AcrR family transcriptional regulator [Nocardia sp. BMG51109]|uniref:TetR/AcrR family transcriptional regulator n=1 Tax=Nocardia sp. BMG51109 TaxID=1056816 RepID=UPI0004B2641F|nr:TetR/AcrR family transcriptional regulator [Nocardia sp. BMG51109]